MTRVVFVSSFVLVALAACGPSDEGPLSPACQTGQVVCGSACCTAEQQCNTATGTCEAKCAPNCRSRECGSDGCGGTCGTCGGGFLCQEETGLCYQCKPSCTGKTCGSDGCGGSCGTCPTGQSCQGGTCGACQPQCSGKSCGPDGCGGQCGTCPGGACDPSGKCVECMNESDCASSVNGRKCSPDRRCVACLTNFDCKSDGSILCDTSTNRCEVACSRDADCSGTPGAPRCDTSRGECVACLSGTDCGGATPSCDPATRSCVGCSSDFECVSSGKGNRCLGKQKCVQCTSSADCGGGACNTVTNTCGECASDTDCSGNATRKFCDSTNLCVACKSDANCGGAAPACHATLRTCVGCTGDGHCAGKPGTPRCQAASNTCVQCLSNTDCSGGTCQSGQCISSTSGGDTCAAPAPINLASGIATVNGDLTNTNHDISGSCGGSGRDVVYQFTLTSTKDLTVSVQAVTGSMQPVVYLATSCGGAGELACAVSGGATASFTRQGLPAGTYFLWVDSTAGFPQGQFSLTVTAAEPPPAVAGDTCGTAIPVSFNAQGNATVTGTTNGAKAEYTSRLGCASSGPDIVYRFTTQFAGPFSAQLIAHFGSHSPSLQLLGRCPTTASGDELACDQIDGSRTASLSASSLPAGTWFLVVDSSNSFTGGFDLQLSVTNTPPPTGGERCGEATPLTITNNVGTVSGTTVGRVNDGTSTTCSPNSSADVVYSFNNPVKQNVLLRLNNKSSGYRPAMYLQSPTCGSSELACQYSDTQGGNLLRLVENVPAGTQFLWVDSYTGTPSGQSVPTPASSGSFDLSVHLGVPAAGTGGESCSAGPVPLNLTSGFAFGRGSITATNVDNQASTCAAAGKDVVYRFSLPPGYARLRIYTEFDATSFAAPAIQLTRGADCASATAVACNAGGIFTQPWASVTVDNPPADTYFMWLEWVDDFGFGGAPNYYFELLAE